MRNQLYILGLFFLALILMAMNVKNVLSGPFTITYPKSWPKPIYDFKSKPLTHEKVELGRHLFYDPTLSKDNIISCSSCHLSYTAFTHVDHALSHGIDDRIGTRNSPVLINLAWQKTFMWDGSITNLDVQASAPIHHPDEMGENIEHVIAKLQKTNQYPHLFYQAFGDSIITSEHLFKAISQFQLTLISANSKYDRVKRKETTFTDQEKRGYRLFKKKCNSCHQEPLFTRGDFANNGLPMDTLLTDIGRAKVSLQPQDSLKFKIPTLRNIEFSKPYMHDGRFTTLNEVLDHYAHGIQSGATPERELKSGIPLSHKEQIDIISFLLTLSDKEFLFNPDFAYPRNLAN